MLSVFHSLQRPPVHILMPAYNAEKFIASALESIGRQTYENIRLIIIDDGSTDDTLSTIRSYLTAHPEVQQKVTLESVEENQGVGLTRKALWAKSNALNPRAYKLWLDADDQYTEDNFVESVIDQMTTTEADICVFNFAIDYEDPSQIANAAGLLRDQTKSKKVLEAIFAAPQHLVAPLDVNVMELTSLGWIKCYGPSVELPEAADHPFEDFVAMAALLQANKITALDPEREPIRYLRRSTSICGQRTPENFTLHIPTQLQRFFEVVVEATQNDAHKITKLEMAQAFVLFRLDQYTTTLSTIVEAHSRADINASTLATYQERAEKIKEQMSVCLQSAMTAPAPQRDASVLSL